MEETGNGRVNSLFFSLMLLGLLGLGSPKGANGYRNYTVRDTFGWYDQLQPKVDYQRWANGKSFSLGDFLIFNTDRNHSVIQTYNMTTYINCNNDDALENDTISWSSGPPVADRTPVTIAVPLVKEGPNYFFSGNYDGEQCKNGLRFNTTVMHGQGLPPNLMTPPPSPPSVPSPESANSTEDGGAKGNSGLLTVKKWTGVVVGVVLIGMTGI